MRKLTLLTAALLLAGCSAPASPPAAVPATGTASAAVAPSGSTGSSGVPAGGAPQTAVPPETTPPGDIPDNVAYVKYTNTTGKYSFTHPEGWAENAQGSAVTFTDKLNGLQAMTGAATAAPTTATAKSQDVPTLQRSQVAFELRSVSAASVPGGQGVKIVYRRNSAPDPVTAKQYRDEVERYELVSGGREVIIELFGPVGSDNVDAYQTMITSLRLA